MKGGSCIFGIFWLIAVLLLALPVLGSGGPAKPHRRVVATPATKEKQHEKPDNVLKALTKIYRIDLVQFGLTEHCRIKLVLQNQGAKLDAGQLKKSTLKVGREQPVSLAQIDPAMRLKKKGQTATFISGRPLAKSEEVTVVIKLFNGVTKSWHKLLKPACGRPHVNLPASARGGKIGVPSIGNKPHRSVSPQPGRRQDALRIQRAFVRNNTIHVALVRGGPAGMDREGLARAVLTIRYGGKTKSLPLGDGRTSAGGISNVGGKMVINTGIVLAKKETISLKLTGVGRVQSWQGMLAPSSPPHRTGRKRIQAGSMISAPGTDSMFQPQPEPPGHPGPKDIKPAHRKIRPAPGQDRMIRPGRPEPAQTARPMSGEGPVPQRLLPALKDLPQTFLQVQRLGGDLETWDSYGATDTSQQKMKFRWKTGIESLHAARWQVSLSPDFSHVIDHGGVGTIPARGNYGRFSIDFGRFSAIYAKPAVFYVRVKPLRYAGMGGAEMDEDERQKFQASLPVRITVTEAGSSPQTGFHLPHTYLKVVFQNILLVDDSDDLSGGDMHFRFTVNGVEKVAGTADDQYNSGEVIPLAGISFLIKDPPDLVPVTITGCDNDDIQFGDHFVSQENYFASACGADPDTASIDAEIFTEIKKGRRRIPYRDFALYAKGESLKFEVRGYYEMYCDPCQ